MLPATRSPASGQLRCSAFRGGRAAPGGGTPTSGLAIHGAVQQRGRPATPPLPQALQILLFAPVLELQAIQPLLVPTAPAPRPTPTTVGGAAESCAVIPQETGGPFPGDGSNGPNVLSQSGVVRSDIRTSIGDASGTAEGVELTLNLTIVDAANGCAPLAGAAVYIWHCTREGEYSMYGQSVAGENFLRGVQQAGADGTMTFTTVFPGCYSGRWPHIHFEVYPTAQAATSASGALTTSQLALPQAACNQAYAATGYELSVSNFSGASLTQDMVFSDGVDQQLAVVDGSLEAGFVASLTITV